MTWPHDYRPLRRALIYSNIWHKNDDRLGRFRMFLHKKKLKRQEHQPNAYLNKFPAEFLHKNEVHFSKQTAV
jgi:hypothetical protein